MGDILKFPLVSFVVTSFNYENYVLKTLQSIKNQTYKNIEIIVVDDKSSDNSAFQIKKFINENPDLKIKLIEHSKNQGQMAAIQTGLKNASGTFVSFIDSDDVLVKTYAETLLRIHLSTSVAFVSSQLVEIGEDDEIKTIYSVSSFQKESNFEPKNLEQLLNIDLEKVDFEILDLRKAPFGGWYWSAMSANMFRNSALDIFLEYDTPQNWRICPDKFILNLAHLFGGSARVYAPLVGYRRHGKNAGASVDVCGNTRYNNDKTTQINIENNKKIRKDTLSFISKNKNFLREKIGKRGVNKAVFEIVISYFKIDLKKVFSCIFKI